MRISSAFPSPYLKAADLQGRRVPVKISRVEMQEFTDEVKPVVYFEGSRARHAAAARGIARSAAQFKSVADRAKNRPERIPL